MKPASSTESNSSSTAGTHRSDHEWDSLWRHRCGGLTAMVIRDTAHRRPSSVIATSHIQLVRPRWRRTASAWITPSVIGRRKFVWLDMPVAIKPSELTPAPVANDVNASEIEAYIHRRERVRLVALPHRGPEPFRSLALPPARVSPGRRDRGRSARREWSAASHPCSVPYRHQGVPKRCWWRNECLRGRPHLFGEVPWVKPNA